MNILDLGGGVDNRVLKFYPEAHVLNVDIRNGHDLNKDRLPKGDWDILFANHIIEHLYNTDFFLDSCKQVMHKETILEIATPNLCAWFNRIVFLFGFMPHSYEVADYNVGRIRAWSDEVMGGHLRLFTPKALMELLDIHGLKVISVVGEPSTYPTNPLIRGIDRLMTLNPSLSSSFRIKCTLPS